jgi:hypothetical protein
MQTQWLRLPLLLAVLSLTACQLTLQHPGNVARLSTIAHHLKMGNGEIRRLRYIGALGTLRGQNPLPDFSDRALHGLRHRLLGHGKAKKLALVAASRQLRTCAWVIVFTTTVYNPTLTTSRDRFLHNLKV